MTLNQSCRIAILAGISAGSIVTTSAQSITGPSSSQSPYLLRSQPGVVTVSIMTVGDSVNLKPDGVTPYRMVGIPDGLGAFDNGDGTFTVVMNHEIALGLSGGVINPVGGVRAHGNPGAFVSKWTIVKSTLQVLKVEDLLPNDTSVFLSNHDPGTGTPHTGFLPGSTTAFSRFCSADLAPPTAYAWTDPATGTFYGTTARIFMTGEETGGVATNINGGGNLGPSGTIYFGRQWNMILTDDPNIPGDQSRTAYEQASCGLFNWENNLANPFSQRKTIVIGDDDTSPGGQVYVWVGSKQTTGNVVERAGLTRQSTNDNLYVVKVTGLAADSTGGTPELRSTPINGTFTLENEGDVSGLTTAGLESLSNAKGATKFLRPEDGSWDPSHPADFYFVTTDRYDQVKDGVGTQIGRSRLYRLRFSDIRNPELGGTITCLLDGTQPGNMFDNLCVDKRGKIIIQEDVGGEVHLGRVWSYGIGTGLLEEVATHDPNRFLSSGSTFLTSDEESSGVIPMDDILGAGWYLMDVQAHYATDSELVEGGQLLAIQVPPGKKGK